MTRPTLRKAMNLKRLMIAFFTEILDKRKNGANLEKFIGSAFYS
jgi:hypothetical protein